MINMYSSKTMMVIMVILVGLTLSQEMSDVIGLSGVNDLQGLVNKLESENSHLVAENQQLYEKNEVNKEILQRLDHMDDRLISIEKNAIKMRHNYSVSFCAYTTEDREYDIDLPVLFDGVLVNDGGFYSNNTGTFLCPVDGYYMFSMHVLADTYQILELQVGGVGFVATYSDATKGHGANSMVVRCQFGQQVYVRNTYGSTTVFGDPILPYTTFSGVLLFQSD